MAKALALASETVVAAELCERLRHTGGLEPEWGELNGEEVSVLGLGNA